MVAIPSVLKYGIAFNVVLGVIVFAYLYSEETVLRKILEARAEKEEGGCIKDKSIAIKTIWFSGMLKRTSGDTWVSTLPLYFRERLV